MTTITACKATHISPEDSSDSFLVDRARHIFPYCITMIQFTGYRHHLKIQLYKEITTCVQPVYH